MLKLCIKQARTYPSKNLITRAIGIKNTVETDTAIHKLQKNDIIVLCTDGLCGMLKDEEMAKILNKRTDLERKAELLVAEANKKGGFDNISLILVQI